MLLLPLLLVFALAQGAPLFGLDQDASGRIADEYVVIYKKETGNDAIFAHQAALSLNIMHTYNITDAFRGFSAHLTEQELAKVLDAPFVKEVHCNSIIHAYCTENQSPSTSWGLSRVSHQNCLTGSLEYEFIHHPNAGQGVNIYIQDTGVNALHQEFNGRVAPGQSFVDGQPPANVDENGHGTHCAGTAAGNAYGIARNARIIPVKVLGRTGSGSLAGVVGGINWAANDYNQPNFVPSIASMSLGGGRNEALNSAVEAAISIGLPFAIAAGNSNTNACNFSPASAPNAITVGATDLGSDDDEDVKATYSNIGTCVKIWAPGTDIPSSYIPNSNSYAVLSGTSMACPHVAGVAAVVLQANPSYTPAQLLDALLGLANRDCIANPGVGSPNLLLYNGCTRS